MAVPVKQPCSLPWPWYACKKLLAGWWETLAEHCWCLLLSAPSLPAAAVARWTPESVGDYASGTNHVLPTYGYARMYSGVSLDSFTKKMTVQSLSYEGLQLLGPHVAKMAEVEGLDAHRRAVTLRLESSS